MFASVCVEKICVFFEFAWEVVQFMWQVHWNDPMPGCDLSIKNVEVYVHILKIIVDTMAAVTS
jgi:hypothetical protein